jgi:D-serine dehydratase
VPDHRLSVDELCTPVLAIREAPLRHNITVLADWGERSGVLLAPHAKTTMAPRLLERQLAAGAWGLTVADTRQARIAIASGAKEVIIANEVVVTRDLEWLCDQAALGEAGIRFCIDSLDGLALAESSHSSRGGPPLSVLIEIGYANGRGGVRSTAELLEVAQAIAASRHMRLTGIEGYEGLIPIAADSSPAAVDAFLEHLLVGCEAVAELVEEPDPLITAGGSAYIDRVVEVLSAGAAELGFKLCLRSGCYITHDHGIYERNGAARRDNAAPQFKPAIEVRASVLSHAQADRLVLNCGRRDVSFDAGLPVILCSDDGPSSELEVVALNDQHAHVSVVGARSPSVGTVLRLGVSHPCTALDRWRVIPLVDDSGVVVEAIPTLF